MSRSSDPELLVVHALRLKGFADTAVIAETAAIGADQAGPILEALGAAGLAKYREGRMTGWTLTPEGRADGERRLAAELDRAGAREVVADAYQRFLELNGDMLTVCTDWQMREVDGEQAVNDHSDPAYDTAVIDRLAEIDVAAQPVCADLAGALERFGSYGPRLTEALDRLRTGDTDWFTKPLIDSYHTVWFELHENLLASLGIDRATEGSH